MLDVREDWLVMKQRLEKLPQFGKDPAELYLLLKPILTHFMGSFDSPETQEGRDFWHKIAHESAGSGPHYLSVSLLVFGSSNHQIISMVRLPNVANHDWAVPVPERHANRGLDRHIRAPVLDNSLF